MREIESPYAWMSPRDGDLIKTVLLNAAEGSGRQLRVLEWGAGQSTLSYTQILAAHDLPFQWLALEYDREFFDTCVAPALLYRAGTDLRYPDDGRVLHGPAGTDALISKRCAGTAPHCARQNDRRTARPIWMTTSIIP